MAHHHIQAESACAIPCPVGSASIDAHHPDITIIAAWERRRALWRCWRQIIAISANTPINVPAFDTPVEDKALREAMDFNEETVRSAVAKTRKGAELQAWCALHTGCEYTSEAIDDAMIQGDLAAMEAIEADLDWNSRLTLSVIRSLRALEA